MGSRNDETDGMAKQHDSLCRPRLELPKRSGRQRSRKTKTVAWPASSSARTWGDNSRSVRGTKGRNFH
jgi:hypothetical protein